MTTNPALSLTNLPLLVQDKIIKYFSYTELSRLRSVSKHFHRLCAEELNRSYFQLEKIIHDLQKQIKIKLPRRESERHKVKKKEFHLLTKILSFNFSIHYQQNLISFLLLILVFNGSN